MNRQFNQFVRTEEERQKRIELFKSQIQSMIATSKDAYAKVTGREGRNRPSNLEYSKERIHSILAGGTAIERAQLSQYFFSVSGLYKRIIVHYATFLTYSWLMIPHMRKQDDKLSDKKNKKVYFDAAEFCSTFGIERQCEWFAKQVLVDGGYYGIIHDNGSSVAIQDLPFEFCRSRFKNQQDVNIVEFDMRFFDTIRDEELRKEILKTYPAVVQKGYRAFKNGKSPWIFLPAEIGIYFCFFEERPFFLDLIPLIDDLEDYKEIDKNRNLQGLKRIITQEMPHDGIQLVFEPEEAAEMHAGLIDMLSDNPDVDAVTSYGKVGLLDLSGKADDYTEVTAAQQLIYDSAGVSKELFSATTEAGINYSLNNDLSMMMVLGERFAHFFTALLNNKFGNRKMSFNFKILPVSNYNKDDYVSKAKDLAAFGYPFLTPVSGYGLDQTSLSDLKVLENDVLELDEVLKPLQSAYTQSGKTNAVTAAASKDSTASAEGKQTEQNKENDSASGSSSKNNEQKKSDTAAEKKSDGGENK